MGNRAYALLTGAFIVVLGAAIAGVTWWMSGGEAPHDAYVVVARSEVTGLKEASPVLYRGVGAGRVEAIRFNPDDFQEIFIRIAVREDLPVTEGTYATLRPQGITGLSQLILHDDGSEPERLSRDGERPPRIPLEPGVLDTLTGSGTRIIDDVEALVGKLNALLSERNRERVGNLLENLETASGRLGTLEERVADVLATVPETTASAERTLAEVRELAVGLQELPGQLETLAGNANALMTTGRSLGQRVSTDLAPRMDRALEELATAGRELQRTARLLQTHPDSLLRGRPPRPPGPGERGYEPSRPPEEPDR
jgi:phospholipid/cholesterol/gamma-HCH transport system substrate-binding protein